MFELIAAIVTGVSVVLAALLGYLASSRKTKRQNESLKHELKLQARIFDFSTFVHEWDSIMQDVQELMQKTEIDRFLILRAWNGYNTPKYTTAVVQIRQGKQEPIQYVHFELDEDYVERLKLIVNSGYATFKVNEMPPSFIKSVYETEEIKTSFWAYLARLRIDSEHQAITYCSFSSRSANELSPDTITRCRILIGRLKGAALAFQESMKSEVL